MEKDFGPYPAGSPRFEPPYGNPTFAKPTPAFPPPIYRDRLSDLPSVAAAPAIPSVPTAKPRVFIVHGHDKERRLEVQLLLTTGGMDAVVLQDRHIAGEGLIDELYRLGDGASFAVVLATADDVGAANKAGALPALRARQNVVLELGFFLGKFGKQRRNRVVVLYDDNLELPSDYQGILYVPFSDQQWRTKLSRAVKKAISLFNINRALGISA